MKPARMETGSEEPIRKEPASMGLGEEAALEKLVMISEEFLQMNAHKINYQNITDIFKDISGALFVVFNIYDPDGLHFNTLASSGLERYQNKITSLMGFSITGKRWPHDPVRADKIKKNILTRFDNVMELTNSIVPHFIVARAQQLFSVGETCLLKIMKDDIMIGDFTFFMPRGITFTNEHICGIFSRQLGLLLTRKRVEEQLLEQSRLLQHSLAQQRILSDIALALNSLEDFDSRMNSSLKKIGEHTGVSRVFIFENNEDSTHTHNTFEWCNDGISSQIANLQHMPYSSIPQWEHLLREEGIIHAEDLSILDEGSRKMLEEQQVKSVVVFALTIRNRFFGFIGFDECTVQKRWTDDELDMLRTLSGIISHAYERRNMELTVKEERDRANQANQAKSAFLANMSHEIRTPMNAILGFSEALYNKLDREDTKKMVESILSGGKLLMSLLNDILDLAKIEAGKLELMLQPVNLPAVLEETRSLYGEKAQRKGIQLTLDIQQNVPELLELDETRIQQILFNLVSNAVKFTHQGHIKITASFNPRSKRTGLLSISIEDTGIGIAGDQVPVIFEDFSQLNPSSTRKYEGTGLGLAICKKLVSKMQGEIWVDSTVGEGSVFHVNLPNVVIGKPSAKEQPGVSPEPVVQFKKSTVLVLDNMTVDVNMTMSLLTGLGLDVLHANNKQEALDIISQYKPALILLDTQVTGVVGYELLQAIKKNPDTHHMPVVACSTTIPAYSSTPLARLFNGFLQKPLNRNTLVNELSKHLPHKLSETPAIPEKELPIAIETLTGETTENLPLIADILREKFLPQWQQVKDQLVIFKIESFSNQLEALAVEHDFDYLSQYAKKLSEEAGRLDIEAMKNTLDRFPQVCDQIENITNSLPE